MSAAAAFHPSSPGIPDSNWARVLQDARPWTPKVGRIVIVGPHPDDEVFGAGGLIAMQSSEQPITLVSVTDGERAYANWPDLASVRRQELDEALSYLTNVPLDLIRLGLPDSEVQHERAALRDALINVAIGAATLVLPYEQDGHPDHNTIGEVGREVAAVLGIEAIRYPIWRWHHGDEAELTRCTWGRFTLSDGAVAAKARSMRCFRSQLCPPTGEAIVPPPVLVYFERPFEAFVL